MKPLLLISLLCFGILNMQAQTALSWVHQYGNAETEEQVNTNAIALNGQGDLYAVGTFTGTVDFNPGPGMTNLISAGNLDVFITKTNASGDLIWAKRIGGSATDNGYDIATDALGNIYIVGLFFGTADFDPNAGTFNLLAIGSADAFVCKLDENGILMWAAKAGGTDFDVATSVSVNSNGDVLFGGYFLGTCNFNPGPGVFNLTSVGDQDAFITQLDAGGVFVWAERFGGTTDDGINDLALDVNDHIISTGWFTGTADFNPGANTSNLTSAGAEDVFVLKLDASGNYVWAKRFGASGPEGGLKIHADGTGNIYTSGFFDTTVDFDPGPNTHYLTSAGQEDIFISKLDSNGDYLWAKRFGSTEIDKPQDITTDESGNLYTTGFFGGTVDFDPNAGTATLTSNGVSNSFISKLSPAGDFVFVSQLDCDNYVRAQAIAVDSEFHIYCGGAFNGTGDFDPGFSQLYLTSTGDEDAFILKLNQCFNSSSIITAAACESYVSPSGHYTWEASGTYLDTLGNATGCDSLITINLTILHQSETEITISACDSYLTPGGDVLTASGIYTDSILNAVGCDSIIVINLTISTLDTSVVYEENYSLTAQMDGATYQWIDCGDGNQPIPEAIDQIFYPVASGSYAVIISANDCVDTSSCHNAIIAGIKDIGIDGGLHLFPNPAKEYTVVEIADIFKDGWLSILDVNGREMYHVPYHGEKEMRVDLKLPAGIYFVKMKDAERYAVTKLVVE